MNSKNLLGSRQYSKVDSQFVWRIAFASLIALVALSGAALGQGRPRVTVSPAVEPRQPVLLVVDGKVVEAESMECKRVEQMMVWLRDLESLGWGKASAGDDGSAIFQGNNVTLSFTKGQGVAKVNSLAVQLPISTYLKEGKLMVPISFVAKSLGYDFDLSNKLVATVNTKPRSAAEKTNTICGRVYFAGKGIGGVTVRAVTRERRTVRNATAKTADDGTFRITGLPNGQFMAYVYDQDNPLYLNRMSEVAAVSDGDTVQLKTIPITRLVAAVSPKPDAKLTGSSGKIALEWTPCPLAARYQVGIMKLGSRTPDYTVACKGVKTQVPVGKLKAGVPYEVMVTALDASGNTIGGNMGASGKPWSFSVVSANPTTSGRR